MPCMRSKPHGSTAKLRDSVTFGCSSRLIWRISGLLLMCNRPFLECGVRYGWRGLFPLFDLLQKRQLERLQD